MQFEGIHWHYRDRDQRTLNQYIDQYKGQDVGARQSDRRSSLGQIFVKILLQHLSDTREIYKYSLTFRDLALPMGRFADLASKIFH